MSGAGFQGHGSEGARARRALSQPMDKQEFLRLLNACLDPRSPLRVENNGLMVHFDADTLQLIPGSPPKLTIKTGKKK